MYGGVMLFYNLLLSINKMAIANSNVDVDVQITILKLLLRLIEFVLFFIT